MANPVRLELITYFGTHPSNSIVSLEELVAILERRIPSKTQEQLWRLAYQAHLPTLEDNDWLVFDREELTITCYGQSEAQPVISRFHDVFSPSDS